MNQSADYISWIRRQVGTRKIFLVFATIIVTDPEGRVLLQRRRDFQRWGLPGGALEWDEDIRQCARRELAEETGLQVGQLQLVGIYTEPEFDVTYPNGDEVQQFTICLHGQMNGGGLQDDPQETEGHAFLPLPAIDGLDLLPWYRVMLHDFARGVMPVFRPPVQAADTVDQIANVRPLIGSAPLIAVGASALLQREDGRILMVQRQDNGAWVLPAGYSDLGENVAQTAVREMREETGYLVQPQRIIGVYSSPDMHHTFPNGDQVKNVGVLFRVTLKGGAPALQRDELRRMAWLSPAEIERRLHPHFAPFFSHIRSCLHNNYFLY